MIPDLLCVCTHLNSLSNATGWARRISLPTERAKCTQAGASENKC